MNTKNLITAFKVVAVIEAVTWVVLLTASVLKRVLHDDSLVFWPGCAHAAAFIVLVVLTLLVARAIKWDIKTLALGLIATVLPFCSVVFEVWAQKAGKLDEASASSKNEPANAIGR